MERKALCLLILALVVAFVAARWEWVEEAQAAPEAETLAVPLQEEENTLSVFPLEEAAAQANSMTSDVTTLSVSSGGVQLSCTCTPTQGTFQPTTKPEKVPEIDSGEACWKRSNGRGVGKPLSTCKSGYERNGALCYPNCPSGFKGNGPVCWQNCPAGFRDDGAHCGKPSSYGRGAGYAIWDENKCKKDNSQGCEKNGAMWYPKCRAGFHAVGCCVCSPNCINGMRDIGVSCEKKSQTRGAGYKMECENGLQEDAGLCYKPCGNGYKSIGPVCWQGKCPASKPHECGALCTKDASVCTEKIKNMVLDSIGAVTKLAMKDPEGIYDTAKAASNFVLPLCPDT